LDIERKRVIPSLRDWLKKDGYKVYSEIYNCDVVAVKDNIFIGFELKMSCSDKVIHQAYCHIIYFGQCYVVIPTNPEKKVLKNV